MNRKEAELRRQVRAIERKIKRHHAVIMQAEAEVASLRAEADAVHALIADRFPPPAKDEIQELAEGIARGYLRPGMWSICSRSYTDHGAEHVTVGRSAATGYEPTEKRRFASEELGMRFCVDENVKILRSTATSVAA